MEPISLCKGIRFCQSAQQKGYGNIKTVSKESTLIKSTVGKALKITKDDAKTIQDEKDNQMVAPNTATEKELKEIVVDIEKKYDVYEEMGEAPLKNC